LGASGKKLKPSGPFRFHESLLRYQHSPDELVNRYDGKVFRRVVEDRSGGLILLEARAGGEGPGAPVALSVRAAGPVTKSMISGGEVALRHLLAFDLDMRPFYKMARGDPHLAPLVRRFRGLKPVRYLDLFEALVTAITTQQVNLTFGGLTRSRLVKRWGEKLRIGDETHFAFPRPERLARARVDTLLKMQFSGRKAEYVIGVARAAAEGELESSAFRDLPLEEAVERLCRLRGVGRWSAEQALYRALGRVDALPGGDLGVQKIVAHYYFGEKRVDESRARETARQWEPWGSLATTYLFAAWRAGIPPRMGKK
jgi:DNA-3-methyladenine glycosylase II